MPEEWPELHDALKELLAATVLDPAHAPDSFSQWCEKHAAVIQAMCVVRKWTDRVSYGSMGYTAWSLDSSSSL